ncbi:DUF1643 domain-containing protein [Candidatus Woesearchaeota archaeon]|nr:DUF1643 domain-containing protein [Candidatus Woesearchaeota archaeon]
MKNFKENIEGWQVPNELVEYRYRLGFEVNPNGKKCMTFIGLNPSDAHYDYRLKNLKLDKTAYICSEFSLNEGFREVELLNLFAYRHKEKGVLLKVEDPLGENNDEFIKNAVEKADKIVVAWGRYFNSKIYERAKEVEKILKPPKNKVYCIRKNQDGSPTHASRQSPKLKIEKLYFNN